VCLSPGSWCRDVRLRYLLLVCGLGFGGWGYCGGVYLFGGWWLGWLR
jgi:hypothetical protein